MKNSRFAVNDRLVLRTVTPAGGEKLLLGFERQAVVKNRDEIPQPSRRFGSWIKRIHNGPALSDGHQNPGALKFFKLPLYGIERNLEIAGNRPSVRFTMMEQVKQDRFRRPTSKNFSQCRKIHDLDIGSYDRNVKSVDDI